MFELFGSRWVGVALLLAALAIGLYVISKPAGQLDVKPRANSSESSWTPKKIAETYMAKGVLPASLCPASAGPGPRMA
jgi:hypothetical protein